MKNSIALVGLCLLLGIGIGCAKKAPACGDDRTKEMVLSISKKEIKKQLRTTTENRRGTISDEQWEKEWQEVYADRIQLALDKITTKDVNEKVGSYQCAGTLGLTIKGMQDEKLASHTADITFTSELSADREDSFVVSVGGLRRLF